MQRAWKILLIIAALLLNGSALFAQDKPTIPLEFFYADPMKNDFRKLLSKLNFSLSTGYGNTLFRHNLNGYGIAQENGQAPVIFLSNIGPGIQYSNWINTSTLQGFQRNPDNIFNSDTDEIGFRGLAFNIPLKATIHVDIHPVRIGAGFSYEYMNMGGFRPISFKDQINTLPSPFGSAMVRRYFLVLGADFYRYNSFNFAADMNLGVINLGRKFDREFINKSPFVNLGLVIEYELSEYFRLFVRPSVEWKTYTLSIAEIGIRHIYPAAFINVGVTYRMPELRRCFLNTCHAQVDHRHGNGVYRSRMHPIYKKQNPHHGENYPKLIRYKGKNKRKLNPY